MIRAALSARASTATVTSDAASRAAVAVQAKVLGMAHNWGRLKHGAVHHGPPSKNRDYRSTPTSFCGAVRRLCRIDSFSIQVRRSRDGVKVRSRAASAGIFDKTDDLARHPLARFVDPTFTSSSIKEKPCEEVSLPLPALLLSS